MKDRTRNFLLKWFNRLDRRNILRLLSDKTYVKIIYRLKFNKKLNLKDPKTFNEKLQWLKLYNRKPEYSKMVDKYEAKQYIAEKIGQEYIIPTLGVWDKFSDIDFDALPNQFVLKCTHDSGGLVICRDKNKFDKESAKIKIEKSLKTNYYWHGREWPYKNVKPRIIAEKYVSDNNEKWLTDYKFFCFNGEPKICYISKDKSEDPRTDFFDMDFNHLELRMKDPNSEQIPQKPIAFEEMKKISKILSAGQPHLRVDFYYANKKLYVGELTFFHNGGFTNMNPEDWGLRLGEWIELPNITKKNK